jgi:hypothetical protein
MAQSNTHQMRQGAFLTCKTAIRHRETLHLVNIIAKIVHGVIF